MKSSSDPLSQGRERAERENPCFKDVSQRVMKARHNEPQRPCSYLQSIEKVAGGVEDDTASEIDKDASWWAAFEMQIKRVI